LRSSITDSKLNRQTNAGTVVNDFWSLVMSVDPSLSPCIIELKTRARLGLNALDAGDTTLLDRAAQVCGARMATPPAWKLRATNVNACRSVGFRSWEQARTVLSGQAQAGDDMGAFWHAPRCSSLLNHWFASYDDAWACWQAMPGHALLPYRRQFVVVGEPYLRELGLTDVLQAHADEARGLDMAAHYGDGIWQSLCAMRLRAPDSTWIR
jgi:hypothetical protein